MRSVPGFFRSLLFALCASAALSGAQGVRDPEFDRVPFNEWLSSGAKTSHFGWSVYTTPAELSPHQRLLQRVVVSIDGRELERRRAQGELIIFIQYQDAAGALFQNHTTFDLNKIQPGIRSSNLFIAHFAFMLPGDYNLSLAVWHSATGEHSVNRRRLSVARLSHDPLPAAWNGLPSVEFTPFGDYPDTWFLPDVKTKLNLPVETHRPVRIELVLNTGMSERNASSLSAMRRNMSLLVPAVKALSAMKLTEGSVSLEILDLTHRKVAFSQREIGTLDWPRMRAFFEDVKPGIVDVQTLASEWKMRSWFAGELQKRMHSDDGAAHMVVVLSGPAFLPGQEAEPEPPEPADANHRLLYIRYRSNPFAFTPGRMRPPGGPPRNPPAAIRPLGADDLQKAAAPFHPRIFEAVTSEDFRRIMAAVIEEIAHL